MLLLVLVMVRVLSAGNPGHLGPFVEKSAWLSTTAYVDKSTSSFGGKDLNVPHMRKKEQMSMGFNDGSPV